MATYKTPGVFIEEIPRLGSSIAGVPTAITGFVGYTEKALFVDGSSAANQPVRITSLLEFQQIFGGPFKEKFQVTLTGIVPTPTAFSVVPTSNGASLSKFILFYQVQMFYANGGGTCYIVSVGNYSSFPTTAAMTLNLSVGIDKYEQIDEVTILCTPESVFLTTIGQRKAVYDKMATQCSKLQDRFAILDTVHNGNITVIGNNTIFQDATDFRNNDIGANNLKYVATYYPALNTPLNYSYADVDVAIVDNRPPPSGPGPYAGMTLVEIGAGVLPSPDITLFNNIKAELAKYTVKLYPSATMAGVYAQVDAARGVWKAPANVGLTFVNQPSIIIDDEEQQNLNVDSVSGKSINAIRTFAGRGVLVWGARTLAGNDNEWRYINVRRLFTYVEESAKKATEFVVFESNTANTWQRVKGMIEAFLTGLWRDGALAGATPKDAFFVRVGLGTTMTAQDILEGKMIVEIGMAAARPAEFIILRFEHKLQES